MIEQIAVTFSTAVVVFGIGMFRINRKLKRIQRETKKTIQQALWNDRQIRNGNVPGINRSNSGR